jgi:hypothetical protein
VCIGRRSPTVQSSVPLQGKLFSPCVNSRRTQRRIWTFASHRRFPVLSSDFSSLKHKSQNIHECDDCKSTLWQNQAKENIQAVGNEWKELQPRGSHFNEKKGGGTFHFVVDGTHRYPDQRLPCHEQTALRAEHAAQVWCRRRASPGLVTLDPPNPFSRCLRGCRKGPPGHELEKNLDFSLVSHRHSSGDVASRFLSTSGVKKMSCNPCSCIMCKKLCVPRLFEYALCRSRADVIASARLALYAMLCYARPRALISNILTPRRPTRLPVPDGTLDQSP